MLRILRIIQDLVDILRICSFQEHDLRPPFLEIGADLNELIHAFRITGSIHFPLQELLDQEPFIAVLLAFDRLTHEALRFLDDVIHHLIDCLMPDLPIEIHRARIPIQLPAGKRCIIAASIRRIHMSNSIAQTHRIIGETGRRLEDDLG